MHVRPALFISRLTKTYGKHCPLPDQQAGAAIGMLPLLAAGSGPLVIRHMGGWLRRGEQGAILKKAFLLAGNPPGWYAWAMPPAG